MSSVGLLPSTTAITQPATSTMIQMILKRRSLTVFFQPSTPFTAYAAENDAVMALEKPAASRPRPISHVAHEPSSGCSASAMSLPFVTTFSVP